MDEAGRARERLSTEVLPDVARWLASILSLAAQSTALHAKPRFDAVYQDGVVRVTRSPH
jgi:hypothetical protein